MTDLDDIIWHFKFLLQDMRFLHCCVRHRDDALARSKLHLRPRVVKDSGLLSKFNNTGKFKAEEQ